MKTPILPDAQNLDMRIRSEWRVEIGGQHGLSVYLLKGQEPCWFHRKMQELLLGFKWRKDQP